MFIHYSSFASLYRYYTNKDKDIQPALLVRNSSMPFILMGSGYMPVAVAVFAHREPGVLMKHFPKKGHIFVPDFMNNLSYRHDRRFQVPFGRFHPDPLHVFRRRVTCGFLEPADKIPTAGIGKISQLV